jgi:hypothetical protein
VWWALLLACGPPPYDLDDVLQIGHLQALGTHNSYHVMTTPLDAWAYTHPPLGEQLDLGVRQFELDGWWDDETGWRVYHVPFVDEGTNCPTMRDCLAALRAWSDQSPGHHPLVVLFELKSDWDAEGPTRLDALAADLAATWPDRTVTPDVVRGDAADLPSAVAEGWPTLGEVRQTLIPVVHVAAGWSDEAAARSPIGEGQPWFVDADGDPARPWAAVHVVNDPWDARIPGLVAAGHLVRTRADADGEEARAGDTARRDQALSSGAQFVSTDFPIPHPETGYVVVMPQGTPSRCDPATAPPACVPEQIEGLDRVR